MKTTSAILLALFFVGCHRAAPAVYDPAASAAYHAAWQKKMGGDGNGYRAALREVAAKYPDSRAGRRAKEELERSPTDRAGIGGVMLGTSVGLIAGGAAAFALKAFHAPQR
jgi:hypothetical protein